MCARALEGAHTHAQQMTVCVCMFNYVCMGLYNVWCVIQIILLQKDSKIENYPNVRNNHTSEIPKQFDNPVSHGRFPRDAPFVSLFHPSVESSLLTCAVKWRSSISFWLIKPRQVLDNIAFRFSVVKLRRICQAADSWVSNLVTLPPLGENLPFTHKQGE